jgi:hypothetical protein
MANTSLLLSASVGHNFPEEATMIQYQGELEVTHQATLVPIKNDAGVIDRIKIVIGEKELTFVVDPEQITNGRMRAPFDIDMTSTTHDELREFWQLVLPFFGFRIVLPEDGAA